MTSTLHKSKSKAVIGRSRLTGHLVFKPASKKQTISLRQAEAAVKAVLAASGTHRAK
jgi:hypothetical protein